MVIFVLFYIVAFGDLLAIVEKVFNDLPFVLDVVFDELIGVCGSADGFFLQQLLLSRLRNVTGDWVYVVVKILFGALTVLQITIFVIQFFVDSPDFLLAFSQLFLLFLDLTAELWILLLKQK